MTFSIGPDALRATENNKLNWQYLPYSSSDFACRLAVVVLSAA